MLTKFKEESSFPKPVDNARDMLAAARQSERHASTPQEHEAAEAARRQAYRSMAAAYDEKSQSDIQITSNVLATHEPPKVDIGPAISL